MRFAADDENQHQVFDRKGLKRNPNGSTSLPSFDVQMQIIPPKTG